MLIYFPNNFFQLIFFQKIPIKFLIFVFGCPTLSKAPLLEIHEIRT